MADPAWVNVRTLQYFQDHDFHEIMDDELHRKRQGHTPPPSTRNPPLIVLLLILLSLTLTCHYQMSFH